MVRHGVLFRFTDATTAADVERISAAAGELPKQIPAIRAYTLVPIRLGAGSWDYAIVGDFDDADGWAEYDGHPDHEHFRAGGDRPPRGRALRRPLRPLAR